MKKLPLVLILSMAAGLLGGILSHYVWPQAVHAQSQTPAPREVRAQSFAIVNDKGEVQGIFSFDEPKSGRPAIKLFDGSGHEIWSAGGSQLHQLGAH